MLTLGSIAGLTPFRLQGRRGAGGGTPPPAAFFGSIDARGWSAQAADPGALPAYSTGASEWDEASFPQLAVTSSGHDTSGNATTHPRTIYGTKEVRQPWTGAANTHLLRSAATVALSEYVLANDNTGTVTNNSTKVSPAPIMQWAMRNRQVFGDTADVYFTGAHWSARGGRPINSAWVWFESTDGLKSTAKAIVSVGLVLDNGGNDRFAVVGYKATVNTATWSDGSAIPDGTAIILQGTGFPRIGIATRTTVGGTVDGRGWAPQTHLKHTARKTNPVHVYVSSSGADTTVTANGQTSGVQKVSTDLAALRADTTRHFATQKSAIEALDMATDLTGGFTDGCFVNLAAGSHASVNTLAGTYQSVGELIIRTDPALANYAASVTTASVSFRQTWLTYMNVDIVRATTTTLSVLTGGRLAIHNCTFDANGQTSAIWAGGPLYVNGLTFRNTSTTAASNCLTSGTLAVHMARGVKGGTLNSGTFTFGVDSHNLLGSDLANPLMVFGGRDPSNTMINGVAAMGVHTTCLALTSGNIVGFARLNAVFQWTRGTSDPMFRPSGDSNTANIEHLCDWGVTEAGASLFGRRNGGYDETTGTYRVHDFWSEIGTIPVAHYTKHDWFFGANVPGATVEEAQQKVGGWSVLYAVGARGNLHQYVTAAGYGPNFGPGGSENPAYFGVGSKWPAKVSAVASQYVRLDPLFVGGNTKATQYDGTTATAGTGGPASDYQVQNGSPAIGMVADEALPFAIDGTARTRGTAGAYA